MKCQILFSRKNKKNIISLSAESASNMVNVTVPITVENILNLSEKNNM